MKKLISLFIILCLIIGTCTFVFAEDGSEKKTKYIYVDASAAEGGTGTKDNPFRTLEEARDMLRPMLPKISLPDGGVCVVIAEGEYRFSEAFTLISDDSGKDGRFVTYRGEGKVYFIGGESGTLLNGSIVSADNVKYIAFENINFRENLNAPLLKINGSNVAIKNCTFSDSAILSSNTDNSSRYALSCEGYGIEVDSCEFYNVEGAVSIISGEDISHELSTGRIYNSYIHDVSSARNINTPAIFFCGNGAEVSHNDIATDSSDAIVFSGTSHNISYNKIYASTPDTAYDAISADGGFLTYGNTVEYNFIDSLGGVGINLTEGVSGSKVIGNVIKDMSLSIYLGGGRNTKISGNMTICTKNDDASGILYDSSFRDSVENQYKTQTDNKPLIDEAFAEKIEILSEVYPELKELCYSIEDEEALPFTDPAWYFNPADSEVSNNVFYVGKTSPALSVVTEGGTEDGMPYQVRHGSFYSNAMMPRGDFSDFTKMKWNNFSLKEKAVIFSVLPDFEKIPFEKIGLLDQKPVMYFIDISEDDWFYPWVSYAFDNALMSGTNSDGTMFSPFTVTTRAMLVQMLYNLEGMPSVEYTDVFRDVSKSDWYTPAVMWAYKNGITTGTGDGRFDPNVSVTREQVAVFLYRFISEYKGEPQEITGNLDGFDDKDDVSDYAGFTEAVTWAVLNGIISGKNESGVIRLAPGDVAQRCETAAVIARFHERFVK